jgi:hypothetical protein
MDELLAAAALWVAIVALFTAYALRKALRKL